MTDVSSVTLLYTAHLEGDLRVLPRLFTLIQQERRAAEGPVFLVDLGDTCSLEAWICPATQGRAPLIVLDSMGYDAALIGGPEQVPIPVNSLYRLLETIVMPVIVWNTAARLAKKGVTIHLATGSAPFPVGEPGVRVDRAIDDLPEVGRPAVTLGDVPQGVLARVDVAWPAWTVSTAHFIPLSPTTPPDPTIGAVVDLVENEARLYAQQQGGLP